MLKVVEPSPTPQGATTIATPLTLVVVARESVIDVPETMLAMVVPACMPDPEIGIPAIMFVVEPIPSMVIDVCVFPVVCMVVALKRLAFAPVRDIAWPKQNSQ